MTFMFDATWISQERAKAVQWARDLLADDFVIFDAETTGLEISDEFVQVGVVDRSGAVVLDSLVRPTQPISPGAAAVHGLSPAHLLHAPGFGDVYPRLSDALGGWRVVVYNAAFDSRILKQTCRLYDLPLIEPVRWDCAMLRYAQYRGVWNANRGSFRWHRLTNACALEGVTVQDAHAAIGDCLMTLRLIEAMAASG